MTKAEELKMAIDEQTRLMSIISSQEQTLAIQKENIKELEEQVQGYLNIKAQLRQQRSLANSYLGLSSKYLTIIENISYGISEKAEARRHSREAD